MCTSVCSPVPAGAGEHPRLRRLVGCLLALLASLAAVLAAPASPAYAHAQLVSTFPVNGAHLTTAPREIVLAFSEPINLVRDGIRLLGPTGAVPGVGPARIDPAASTKVLLSVPAGLGEGVYTVSWRVVSTDSHPIHGAFVFGVGDVTIDQLPDMGALTDSDPPLAAMFWLFRWLSYAGLALLAGGVCFLLLCWPPGWASSRAQRLITSGWVASLAFAVGVLLLQGPYAAGGTLAQTGDASLLASTLGTDYGRYVVARLGLLVIGGALVVGAVRFEQRRQPLGVAAALVLGVGLPVTWVGTGHANAQGGVVPRAVDAVHVSAMAVWLGGLALLLLCVLPRSAANPTGDVAMAVTRFSRIAGICVATLVVSGVYQAWRTVGSIDALSGSAYGTLLVFKLAGVGVLLWLGAMSRSMVRRRFVLPEVQATNRSGRRAGRAREQQDLLARAQLGWSVRAESVIALAVIALTAMLVATPPAARPEAEAPAAVPQQQGTSTELAVGAGGSVRVSLDPAARGPNSLTLVLRRADGSAWTVPEVTAALRLPEQDLGPLPVPLTQVAPGEYRSQEVTIPASGTWRLAVTVRTSEIDETTVETDITVA